MQSSPIPFYLVSLSPENPPQHPVLEHPQPMFPPQCQRPSCTPIQNIHYTTSTEILLLYSHQGDYASSVAHDIASVF
jgi:hypothetical protein